MKRLLQLFAISMALVWHSLPAGAATVIYAFTNFNQTLATNGLMISETQIGLDGTVFNIGVPIALTNALNGAYTNLLNGGSYTAQFIQLPGYGAYKPIPFFVPYGDNGTYYLSQLQTNIFSTNAGNVAQLFAGPGIGLNPANGKGAVTVTNTGVRSLTVGSGLIQDVTTGDVTIASSGVAGAQSPLIVNVNGAGFSETNLNKLTATNAAFNFMFTTNGYPYDCQKTAVVDAGDSISASQGRPSFWYVLVTNYVWWHNLAFATNQSVAGQTFAQQTNIFWTVTFPILQARGLVNPTGGTNTIVMMMVHHNDLASQGAAQCIIDEDNFGQQLRSYGIKFFPITTLPDAAWTGTTTAQELIKLNTAILMGASAPTIDAVDGADFLGLTNGIRSDFVADAFKVLPNAQDLKYYSTDGIHPMPISHRLLAAEIDRAFRCGTQRWQDPLMRFNNSYSLFAPDGTLEFYIGTNGEVLPGGRFGNYFTHWSPNIAFTAQSYTNNTLPAAIYTGSPIMASTDPIIQVWSVNANGSVNTKLFEVQNGAGMNWVGQMFNASGSQRIQGGGGGGDSWQSTNSVANKEYRWGARTDSSFWFKDQSASADRFGWDTAGVVYDKNLTAKTLVTAGASGAFTSLSAGTDGQMLVQDSSQTLGVKWTNIPAGGGGGGGSGTVTQVAGPAWLTWANSTTTPTATANGAMATLDSATFTNAVSNLALTANTALTANANKALTSSTTTDTELAFVHNVTSAIQTQLNARAAAATTISTTPPMTGGGDLSANRTFGIAGLSTLGNANQFPKVNTGATAWEMTTLAGTANQILVAFGTGTATLSLPQDIGTSSSPTFGGLHTTGNIISDVLTASRAVVTDGSKNIASSSTTATQLGYLSTATSDVQVQIAGLTPTNTAASLTFSYPSNQIAGIFTGNGAALAGLHNTFAEFKQGKLLNRLTNQVAAPLAGNTKPLVNITGQGVAEELLFDVESGDLAWNGTFQVYFDGEAIPSIDAELGTLFLTQLEAHTTTNKVGAYFTKHLIAGPYGLGGHSGAMTGVLKFDMPFTNGMIVKFTAPPGTTGAGEASLYASVKYRTNGVIPNYRLRSQSLPFYQHRGGHTKEVVSFFSVTNAAGRLVWQSLALQGAKDMTYLERELYFGFDGESLTADGNGVVNTAFRSGGLEDLYDVGWYFLNQSNISGSPITIVTAANNATFSTVAGYDFLSSYGGMEFTNAMAFGAGLKEGNFITTGFSYGYCYLYYEDMAVPYAPSIPSMWVSPASGQITIQVAPPLSQGSQPVTYYYGSLSPGGATFNIAAGSTTATVSSLANATAYTVSLLASNSVGVSLLTNLTCTPQAIQTNSLVNFIHVGTERIDLPNTYHPGMSVIPLKSMHVTKIGRFVAPGNALTHALEIYSGTTSLASGTLNLSGATTNGFSYVTLGSPLALTAGTTYTITTTEQTTGTPDVWYNNDNWFTQNAPADIQCVGASYIAPGPSNSGQTAYGTASFGPVDIIYTIP